MEDFAVAPPCGHFQLGPVRDCKRCFHWHHTLEYRVKLGGDPALMRPWQMDRVRTATMPLKTKAEFLAFARKHREGQKDAPRVSVKIPLCIYFGDATGETDTCKGCLTNRIEVPTFKCKIHGECSAHPTRETSTVHWCWSCTDKVAPGTQEGLKRTDVGRDDDRN